MNHGENMAEPGDIETAYFFCEDGNNSIGVAPAPDQKGLVSIVGQDRRGTFFHLMLTTKEAALLSSGISEAVIRATQ